MHRLVAKAETRSSSGLSEAVEVESVPAQAVEPPTLYVVAVGISEYRDARMRLSYGAADAVAVAQALRKYAAPLFKKVEARVIVDDQASQRAIVKGLSWLKSQMTQYDVGVFFFAGHGRGTSRACSTSCRPTATCTTSTSTAWPTSS